VNLPSVLAITSEPPWPLASGGHIRTFHLLKALAASSRLRLVCPVQPHQRDALEPIRSAGIDVRPAAVGRRHAFGELQRLAGAALRSEPYVMYRRHAWSEAAAVWQREIDASRPDVLYFDHLDSFVYRSWTARASSFRTAIDLHNVYSLLASRAGTDQPSRLKRAFLRHQSALLAGIERNAARACDVVMAVSDAEADHFRSLGAANVFTVPNGVDCAAFDDLPDGRQGPPTIAFLGTMSWGPNATAARFLALDVLPAVRQQIPPARLLILGRDPPREVLALADNPSITVTGTVPDVRPFLREATLLAVPLEAGGGTRLKILEAFAAGLPVVSTAIGAEGIAAEPGTHFVLAERPDFAGAVVGLLTDAAARTTLAREARALARTQYDWRRIGALATAAVTSLVQLSAEARA
jgi:glycosyltransferase involved in cell wall biosynthesis